MTWCAFYVFFFFQLSIQVTCKWLFACNIQMRFFLLFSIRWENCYRCCRLKWQYYTLYCYYDDRMCANQRWIKDRRRCEAHLCTLRWQRAEETSWSELIWAIWYWLLIWTHIYCNTCYLGSQIRSLVNRLQGNQSIPR